MKNGIKEPEKSALTQKMDVGTQSFDDFQAILLGRSKKYTKAQKRRIDLLSLKYQMEDYLDSEEPSGKSAGDFLKLILNTLKIQQKQFAEYLGLKPSNLSKLLKGERSINYDLAIKFGQLFNHNPMLWIEIQAKNELSNLIRAERTNYSGYSLNDLFGEPEEEYGKEAEGSKEA